MRFRVVTNTSPTMKKSKSCLTRMADQLETLLSLPIEERVVAVDRDVRSRRNQFADIDPFDLANALGVPQPDSPSGDWSFTGYAEKVSAEELAGTYTPVAEVVEFLRGHVTLARFRVLEKRFAEVDEQRPELGFLKSKERRIFEQIATERRLESNLSNGICRVASYSVRQRGIELEFEGDMEDDGHCLYLRTPYDKRRGNFHDRSNWVTESW